MYMHLERKEVSIEYMAQVLRKLFESFKWPRFEHWQPWIRITLNIDLKHLEAAYAMCSSCEFGVLKCSNFGSFSTRMASHIVSLYKDVGKIHSHPFGTFKPRAPSKYLATDRSLASSQVSPKSGVSIHIAWRSSSASGLDQLEHGRAWWVIIASPTSTIFMANSRV